MMRVAIIGGGISGLTAAYELEKARKAGQAVDWQLFEASDRLGGIIQTTRRDGFVLEGGPDGWVSEKTAALELVEELGLESHIVNSMDETRKTYILIDGKLVAVPDRMRMMIPDDLEALKSSPLFSEAAQKAYAAEPDRAAELRENAPLEDESVASFVLRHFGSEVLEKIAAPLLGGVFGGDVYRLSVQAVMPQFVAMERQYGSLITGLRSRAKNPSKSIFTGLRGGMQTLVDAIVATLPENRIHLAIRCESIPSDVDKVVIATSLDSLRALMPDLADFLPNSASSAVLATLAWKSQVIDLPVGFGFLVPHGRLLAATFVDQKFPQRAPEGGKVIRAFFGGESAERLMVATDREILQEATIELETILGRLPEPDFGVVARWPRSLPQYEVGHLERMRQMKERLALSPRIRVLGNMLHGVGLPDLIGQTRRTIAEMMDEQP